MSSFSFQPSPLCAHLSLLLSSALFHFLCQKCVGLWNASFAEKQPKKISSYVRFCSSLCPQMRDFLCVQKKFREQLQMQLLCFCVSYKNINMALAHKSMEIIFLNPISSLSFRCNLSSFVNLEDSDLNHWSMCAGADTGCWGHMDTSGGAGGDHRVHCQSPGCQRSRHQCCSLHYLYYRYTHIYPHPLYYSLCGEVMHFPTLNLSTLTNALTLT